MNYMIIDASGTIIDTIVLDDVTQYIPNDGIQVVKSDTAGIGWTYSAGQFIAPQPTQEDQPTDPVPSE